MFYVANYCRYFNSDKATKLRNYVDLTDSLPTYIFCLYNYEDNYNFVIRFSYSELKYIFLTLHNYQEIWPSIKVDFQQNTF